jgi:hypothetical protein
VVYFHCNHSLGFSGITVNKLLVMTIPVLVLVRLPIEFDGSLQCARSQGCDR